MDRHLHRLTRTFNQAYDSLGLSEHALRRKAIASFAKKFGLIYFRTLGASSSHTSVVRGVTNTIGQYDSNMCIGSHDGYDMVFVERSATIEVPGYPPGNHRWHIMEFDLHNHDNLPFLFIGTRQQSRAFYARLFNLYREAGHVDIAAYAQTPRHFQANYSVVASPSEYLYVTRILTEDVTTTMARHQQPFAIEIQGDSLFVITEATSASVQSLTKMLHYGIWLAKHIDAQVV